MAGRVRIVWMVLDGSKEASLPSRGDKPSLALQQRVTHSIAQWRTAGLCFFFSFFFHFEESECLLENIEKRSFISL